MFQLVCLPFYDQGVREDIRFHRWRFTFLAQWRNPAEIRGERVSKLTPPSFYGERISRRLPVMTMIPESCSRLRKSDGAIFDTAVLLRDVGITSGAGIARNQDAGVNMNKRESFSIAACSSFGRAAIWS